MTQFTPHRSAARAPSRHRPTLRRLSALVALAAGLLGAGSAQAVELGSYVSLTGVAKVNVLQASNQCATCQRFPFEGKQKDWADELVPGTPYGTATTYFALLNPFLEARYDLGRGFKVSGLLSQRWRNTEGSNLKSLSEDIAGSKFFAKNVAISHEDYGSLRIGVMPTRGWSVADYPYATNIGNSYAWADNGAGYGVNTNAVRYTTRQFDVFNGDLVLEATYDKGNDQFKVNKPRFWEFYGQFHRDALVIDAMYQDGRNGSPQAFTKGLFTGLTPDPVDDAKLGSSGQSMLLVMARYQLTSRLEATAGYRRNRWSGAYGVCTQFVDGNCRYNNMFNVNWGGTDANGVPDPGYVATSNDVMAGLRFQDGPWAVYGALTYLGKAKTSNPSQRGQDNTALIAGLGASYDFNRAWQVHAEIGGVSYGQSPQSSGCGNRVRDPGSCTLGPMSLGANAYGGVDSRISKTGNWFGAGVDFKF